MYGITWLITDANAGRYLTHDNEKARLTTHMEQVSGMPRVVGHTCRQSWQGLMISGWREWNDASIKQSWWTMIYPPSGYVDKTIDNEYTSIIDNNDYTSTSLPMTRTGPSDQHWGLRVQHRIRPTYHLPPTNCKPQLQLPQLWKVIHLTPIYTPLLSRTSYCHHYCHRRLHLLSMGVLTLTKKMIQCIAQPPSTTSMIWGPTIPLNLSITQKCNTYRYNIEATWYRNER